MKRHLPNALTCLNLLCGCLALTCILGSGTRLKYLELGAYLVAVAAVADFFDGFVARALRVSSPIGKDLDSLADMVSFGVVPGAMVFALLISSSTHYAFGAEWFSSFPFPDEVKMLVPFAGFGITIFSALRLAKFNNDTRQTNSFIGLPTPACTLVVASLPVILAHDDFKLGSIILNPWVLLGLTVLLSGLLVAELPLFALKFKNLQWRGNRRRFIFVALALGLVGWLHAAGVPLAVLLYVLLSVPGRVRSREALEPAANAPQ
ncbi:MAG: CDP-alcohol phosphatidyltransferase family protein [Janthinobacterium lividum]